MFLNRYDSTTAPIKDHVGVYGTVSTTNSHLLYLAIMGPSLKSLVAFAAALPLVAAVPFVKRDDVSAIKGTTYDYVIVGGGLTGLVVAHRLSEDKLREFCGAQNLLICRLIRSAGSVLVLETGPITDDINTVIPTLANSINRALQYKMMSEPDPELGGLSVGVLVGKVVGGGSVINNMAYDRAAAADYHAWERLGNPGWGWKGLLSYFKKSTTFTPPKYTAEEFNIIWDTSAYGTTGPLQASFPNYDFPDMKVVWEAFRSGGYPTPEEHAAGEAVGAFWIPYALNPDTQTRSDARRTYYDSAKSRPNLKILNVSATEILFDGLTANGIQFTDLLDSTSSKVHAKREAILAAGAVFTPKIPQISGICSPDVLKAAGVKIKKDLPAVGANLQDHPNANTIWDLSNLSTPNSLFSTDPAQNVSAWVQYNANRTGPVTQAHGNSVAFLSLQRITSN